MNSDLNPEFVERYQILLSQDPKSRVFAPLAEAYRKMNWIDHAEKICREGVKYHPHFASGRVVLAKILIDKRNLQEAASELQLACDLSPENILAYRLLSQTLLELKRPKEALKAFKMVLLLNPNDVNAIKTVSRLESLTADEYDDELFQMRPLDYTLRMIEQNRAKKTEAPDSEAPAPTPPQVALQRTLERALSLSDAFVARNDFDKSIEILDQTEEQIGIHPEITKRRRFLTSRNQNLQSEHAHSIRPLMQDMRAKKNQKLTSLKGLLQRVSDRRIES